MAVPAARTGIQNTTGHATHRSTVLLLYGDSEEEAQLCAEAHREFWMDQDEDDEPCEVWVRLRTSHERTVETF